MKKLSRIFLFIILGVFCIFSFVCVNFAESVGVMDLTYDNLTDIEKGLFALGLSGSGLLFAIPLALSYFIDVIKDVWYCKYKHYGAE